MVELKFDKYSYRYPSRRSLVYGRNGMVATSNPMASEVGIEILKAGGNAIDAAVAVAATLSVIEPMSTSIGSDNQAIIYHDGEIHGMNSTGQSPQLIDRERILREGGPLISETGWDPVTVPGTPRGWAEMINKFGRLSLSEVLEPAAKISEEGWPTQTTVAEVWRNNLPKYRNAYESNPAVHQSFIDTFYPDWHTPVPGDLITNQDIADTLREIGRTNADSFYSGAIADDIDAFSRETGGYLRKSDLEAFETEWVKPMSVNYRGYDIWEMPPNCDGIIALQALKILENYDLKDCDTAETHHRIIECVKKAYIDALDSVGDPRFNDIDYTKYLDDDYTRAQFETLNDEQAFMPPPGSAVKGGTVFFCVVDGDGNMVSMIQSNCLGLGAGILIPNRGIQLHCRGTHFRLEENHPNTLEPGKRPFHTIIPSFISKDGVGIGPVGCMGSFLQPQAHVQIYSRIIDSHCNPQEAIDAPRWQWKSGKNIEVEPHMPFNLVRGLQERGHNVTYANTYNFFGRGQIILRQANGAYIGATDGRTDASIATY